jgi:MFS family permease
MPDGYHSSNDSNPGDQRRNLLIFASCVALQYLAAPVIYVGITQAALLKQLGANATLANLPAASFFVMATVAALIAWLKPRVSDLKPVLVWCYSLAALASALVGVALISPISNDAKIGAVILQSAITGATIPTAIAFIWEVLGRATLKSDRGLALGLAYGVGPLLAALGSMGSQLILAGEFRIFAVALETAKYDFPGNFALLFLLEAPVMAAAAILSSRFKIEVPELEEPGRKRFAEVQDLVFGVVCSVAALICVLTEWFAVAYLLMGGSVVFFASHFRDLLSFRLIRMATIVTMIVYIGNVIPSNMALYSEEVMGVDPEATAGYQNAMRFGFKAIAGLALGWILTRYHARAGILVTSGLYVAALGWAICASSNLYLFAFGIFGAGELIGVYAPNYVLSASKKSQMRRSMVMMNVLMAPVGQLGPVFGQIADHIDENGITAFGQTSRAYGFQISFAVCAVTILLGMALAWVWLPRSPDDSENARQ